MAGINKKSPLKLQIVKTANALFLEHGFTATTVSAISKELDISTGNLTYHFPTKEHLLLELVKEMCKFQWDTVNYHLSHNTSPLLAYALEVTAQTAACEYNDIAYDFYVSSYTHPLTLAEIRDWDYKKAQKLFSVYNPDWQESDYILAEVSASGLELAALITKCDDTIPLDKKITNTLNNLMILYNVPECERNTTIEEVLKINYRAIADEILVKFQKYIDDIDSSIA